MSFVVNHIKGIMLVCGVLTCSMVLALVAPDMALHNTFGAHLEGPLAEVVVRSWGSLITLVGGLLIYAAFHPLHRRLVAAVAALGKLIFVLLLLSIGSAYLQTAMLTVVADSVMVLLLVMYLVGSRAES